MRAPASSTPGSSRCCSAAAGTDDYEAHEHVALVLLATTLPEVPLREAMRRRSSMREAARSSAYTTQMGFVVSRALRDARERPRRARGARRSRGALLSHGVSSRTWRALAEREGCHARPRIEQALDTPRLEAQPTSTPEAPKPLTPSSSRGMACTRGRFHRAPATAPSRGATTCNANPDRTGLGAVHERFDCPRRVVRKRPAAHGSPPGPCTSDRCSRAVEPGRRTLADGHCTARRWNRAQRRAPRRWRDQRERPAEPALERRRG